MSETRTLLIDAATRLFADLRTRELSAAAERGEWPGVLWDAVEAAGLSAATRSEARDGPDASNGDVAALLRVAAAFSAPIPLAETLIAEQMLAAAGLPARSGALSIGPVLPDDHLQLNRKSGRWSIAGTLHRVPWGRDVQALVAIADYAGKAATIVVERPSVERRDHNYAGEPRDDLRFDDHVLADSVVGEPGSGWDAATLYFRGALFRALGMAGALERVLELTVTYAKERVAFGRPIGKFQAVQQQIAVLAAEVAAASAAAQAAADRAASEDARFEIACAKARVGEACGIAAGIAHQVHAAMGFTHEHALHLCTRRLWSWRDEFGAETEWMEWVGRAAAGVGGEGLWAFLTATTSLSAEGIPPHRGEEGNVSEG
jgi:acyl-CoA dehydrogenase